MQNLLPEQLGWPKWDWLVSIWSITLEVVLGLAGIAAILLDAPQLGTLRQLAWLWLPSILLLWIIIPLVRWLFLAGMIILKRVRSYGELYERERYSSEERLQALSFIATLVEKPIVPYDFDISSMLYRDGNIILQLPKLRTPKLKTGDILVVIDTDDSKVMGRFQVTNENRSLYFAIGIANVDALWLSFLSERKQVDVVHNLTAKYIKWREQP